MRLLVTIVIFWVELASLHSQSIFSNPITNSNPSSSNPFTSGQTLNVNISATGIGRGTGIGPNPGSDRYNANGWNTASIDLTAYFTFTITPNSGYMIDFQSFVYTGQSSGTGPVSFAFRSSLDGYTSNIGLPSATGTTIALGAAFQDITVPITFRLYGWGASGATGTFSVNSFTFNGSVTAIPLPVTLLNFSNASINDNQELSWTYASPENFDYFDIEHSRDAKNFTSIGKVKEAAPDAEKFTATFIHIHPGTGIHYYRLKMVDLDGSYEYSKVIQGRIDGKRIVSPVSTFITSSGINLNVEQSLRLLEIRLIDHLGHTIYQSKQEAEAGVMNIPLSHLRSGLYYLQINADGLWHTHKLLR